MNNTIKNVFIFASGAGIGSIVTWRLLKTKYELIAQEEINSVKEVFNNRQSGRNNDIFDSESDVKKKAEEAREKPDISEYAAKLSKEGYIDYSEMTKSKKGEDLPLVEPCVIPPEEFGSIPEYDQISLRYYSDGVLADEDGEIVNKVNEIVGDDFAEHFGEYEEDSVFVRNDRLKVDYEILMDLDKYSNLRKRKSHPRED